MCQALGHPTFSRNPYNRYIKPDGIGLMSLCPIILYRNNGSGSTLAHMQVHASHHPCFGSTLIKDLFNGCRPLTTGFFVDPFLLHPILFIKRMLFLETSKAATPKILFFPHSNHYIGSFFNFVQIFLPLIIRSIATTHPIHVYIPDTLT